MQRCVWGFAVAGGAQTVIPAKTDRIGQTTCERARQKLQKVLRTKDKDGTRSQKTELHITESIAGGLYLCTPEVSHQ